MLQLTLLDYIKIFNVKPDLFLVCAVIASLIFKPRLALFFSLFAGMLKDAFSVNAFAIHTLLYPFWSFLIIRLSRKITIETNIIRMVLIFIISFLHSVATGLIFIYLNTFIPAGIFLRIVIIESFYTTAVFPLVFRAINPIYEQSS